MNGFTSRSLFLCIAFIHGYGWISTYVTAFTTAAMIRKSTHCYYPSSSYTTKQQQSTETTIDVTDQSIPDQNYMMDTSSSNERFILRSLCGPFVVQSFSIWNDPSDNLAVDLNDGLFQMQFSLMSLYDDSTTSTTTSTAIHAWKMLQFDNDVSVEAMPNSSTTLELTSIWNPALHHLQINATSNMDHNMMYSEMIAVLSRVLVQYTLSTWYRQQELSPQGKLQSHHPNVTIQIGMETALQVPLPMSISSFGTMCQNNTNDDEYEQFVRTLFQGLGIDTSKSELVEMVFVHNNSPASNDEQCDRHNVLGVVPRHWVHQCNILHRGIGVLVTKDRPILVGPSSSLQQQQPDIYCHRRTSTKRIFPSLYDMFIGGVSLVGEASVTTALREVSEELGITTVHPQYLSQRLFQCIVCTSYNRCVVDVFGYTMNTSTDQIVWQEEEVEWGAFVPYEIIEAAAQLSIHRLQDDNKWPGRYIIDAMSSSAMSILSNAIDRNDDDRMIGNEWKTWDFVPDGLLVWESWLHEQRVKISD